ncbi:DUF3300 domain-containing protein [Horticoccus luteus]|uniref:DUF3300 domain-containing protein n=1 Tax=Horticoccus luteus TaxID=2862869 RepID=A0A8F9TWU4_9BACT|nr:DUF3300 domain-containing protein [Horticoccus luteus]QYM80611.1 DUF3300 domain-containing protein [Horticoccus luteus]
MNAQDVSDESPRTPEELDKLVAPIALYPDVLVALILPASTVPTDVTLAARFLANSDGSAAIEDQPWDESVKALVHYPEVVKWMDENLEWTRELGLAFAAQSTDVMNAVQRMRTQARATGALKDTPQQEVVVRDQIIYIEPATPDVIYVPRYNYDLVYGPPPFGYAGPFLTFGIGYSVGSWLDFDLDWHRRVLWRGVDWRRHDYHVRHHAGPVIVGPPHGTPQRWRPPANRVRPRPGFRYGDRVVGPRALPPGPVEHEAHPARPAASWGNARLAPATAQPNPNGASSVRRWSRGGDQPHSSGNADSKMPPAPTIARPPSVGGPVRPSRPDVSPRPDSNRGNLHFNTTRPVVSAPGPSATVRAPAAPELTPTPRPAFVPQPRPAPVAPPPAMRPVTAPPPRSAPPPDRGERADARRDNRTDKDR